jgi:restriction system protein
MLLYLKMKMESGLMSKLFSANSYIVDGEVCCTRYDWEYRVGVETFTNTKGILSLSKLGLWFEAENGKSYHFEYFPFTKLLFQSEQERDDALPSYLRSNSLKKSYNPYNYTLTPEDGFCPIDQRTDRFDIKSANTLHLKDLLPEQINQIKEYCNLINQEIESDYKQKLKVESDIISFIKRKHNNEIISFIEQFTSDLFLNLKYYIIIQNFFVWNDIFERENDDIPRREFSLRSKPERTQKITDIKTVGRFDSELGYIEDIHIPDYDFQYCDEFVFNNFQKLVSYFTQEITEKAEACNFKISNVYIVWQALIDTVIDYYHDYCITTLGFNDFDGGFDKMIEYMSTHELTNPTSMMAATYYTIKEDSLDDSISNVYERVLDELNNCKRRKAQNDFANSLKNPTPSIKKTTIFDIDLMTGLEFEQFIAKLFEKKGYTVEVTKASGDQGIDVIAEKGGTKIGIQAKCYSGTVGNSAVPEAVAGKQFYRCDKAMVITNNYFTPSATELAAANDVILWNRDTLNENLV